VPILLGENREGEPWGEAILVSEKTDEPVMVIVGAVEPRKQQTRLLKALNDACQEYPDLRRLHIEIFGSLHPASADPLNAQISRNPKIRFHHYASEDQIDRTYAKAWFSAFPSRHEGYGLPIVESLRRGIPCITSNFGAMAEVAAGGGCLTVDVMNDRALVEALLRMISDADLRYRLGAEISARPRRSWGDYAEDILAVIQNKNALKKEEDNSFAAELVANLSDNLANLTKPALGGIRWNVVKIGAEGTFTQAPDGRAPADRGTGKSAILTQLIGEVTSFNLTRDQLLTVADSDVLLLRAQQDIQSVVDAANKYNLAVPLPHRIFFGEGAVTRSIEAAVEISRVRVAACLLAEREHLRARALTGLRGEIPHEKCDLAVVISTFNRGPFVEMNVNWLLRKIEVARLNVRCVVVDNASTDDTFDRLSRFVGNRSFTYICNPANVGMLGNLRVASALDTAKYVWLTGDDDFIVAGAIERTLAGIVEHPGVPFLFHNFEVYHREKLNLLDSPDTFMREAQVMAKTPRPAGLHPVNEIADEHDNLFTAIYPIVFRSDVLAACFNYPFDGIPFGNLVESVPTTKIILESYRYCEAYWFDRPGIAGNAHNSWASHRPRWHLILMPEVFDLARDAGVNPQKIWDWTKIHLALFNDAVKIAIGKKTSAHLSVPCDTDNAFRVFRESVKVPKDLVVVSEPPPPLWNNR
jgi:glycosyltransferase involved in cell wall biosynthesis